VHPRLNELYQQLAKKYEMRGPFLEVGVGAKEDAILSGDYFQGLPQRFATNLSDKEITQEADGANLQFIRCNSNDMKDQFADGQFGTVFSNAVIEHDKYFWRSLDEMKRVLAPGGILVVGAPGYIARKHLKAEMFIAGVENATATYDIHAAPDYWRFSRTAFREVICEGLDILETLIFARTPILVALARKPLEGLHPPVAQSEFTRQRQLSMREDRFFDEDSDDGAGFSHVTIETSPEFSAKIKARKEAKMPEGKTKEDRELKALAKEERLKAAQARKEAKASKEKVKKEKVKEEKVKEEKVKLSSLPKADRAKAVEERREAVKAKKAAWTEKQAAKGKAPAKPVEIDEEE
jgi:SAM-dependent methyltransferase